jgi:hypothetical protein
MYQSEEVSSDLFDPVRQTGDGHISTLWCDTRKEEEPMNHQLTTAETALQEMINACEQGHPWKISVILGYVQGNRIVLASDTVYVSKTRCKPPIGFRQQQHHLRTPQTEQEVLR